MNAKRWINEIRSGISTLLLHKLRSLLTMLGMVFGVSSVIAMLAVGEGAGQEAMERIQKLGSTNIILDSTKPAAEESGGNAQVRMSIYGLTYDDYQRISETVPYVKKTAPVKLLRKPAQFGDRNMDLRIVGTTPDWFNLVQRKVLAGRVITQRDIDTLSRVAVLTENGARRLLAGQGSIGSNVRIGGALFKIVGIVQSQEIEGASIESPDRGSDAYVPLSAVRARFGDIDTIRTAGSELREKVELHQIIAQTEDKEDVEQAAAALKSMLGRFHDKEDYQMHVPLELLRQARATQRTFNIVLGSIAGISLLVGGIGIMNIMLASVTERTREIGIRRAIGAKRKKIIRQFLIETVVLSTVGGLIGIAIGFLVPNLITRFAGMPTVVTADSLILALGISMASGIVFGIYPAARASKLDPIIALRHE